MRVALDTEVLNFCFTNHYADKGVWENNDGKDWNVPTVRSSTISQTEAELQVAARRPIANIMQLPDNEPIRLVGRLTSFSEVLHMNFPSFLTFVDDAGDQIAVTYWEPTARERQSLQTALEVGAAYEVVGRKISYRGIPQVALEGGANLRQMEARAHNWSWSPPRVPIGKLTARSGGQIVRTTFILQKDIGFWDQQASAGQVAASLATDPATGKTLDTRVGCPIGANDLGTWLRAGMEGGRLVEALALVRVGSKGNVELLILRPEDIVSTSR